MRTVPLPKFEFRFWQLAVLMAVSAPAAVAQTDQPGPPSTDRRPAPSSADKTPESLAADIGYDSEPPLDLYERRWRWYTRRVQPQRFGHRDLRRVYGYDSPLRPGASHYRFGNYVPYGYAAVPDAEEVQAQAYVQGRRDERRYRDWKQRHDKGLKAYLSAMEQGIELFRTTDYGGALRQFILAARLHQGDPASRLHAAYAMVALGKYEEAALIVRRALQLQSQIVYLPLDIRDEYGPPVDFDAHLKRLREATAKDEGEPALWMLLGFYEYFSGDPAGACESLDRAKKLAPSDRIIDDLHEAARLTSPTLRKAAETEPKDRS